MLSLVKGNNKPMVTRQSSRNSGSRSEGGARAGKNAGNDDNRSRLKSIDGDKHGVVFEDPRSKTDRRKVNNEHAIPDSGCRRHHDRRSDRLHMGVWWMKRNYCVDLTRPRRKPAGDSATRAFRRNES